MSYRKVSIECAARVIFRAPALTRYHHAYGFPALLKAQSVSYNGVVDWSRLKDPSLSQLNFQPLIEQVPA